MQATAPSRTLGIYLGIGLTWVLFVGVLFYSINFHYEV